MYQRADGWQHACRTAPKRPIAARLQMALDVARGMAALEENDPPIVHRDLKPTNVFIDAGGHFSLDLT